MYEYGELYNLTSFYIRASHNGGKVGNNCDNIIGNNKPVKKGYVYVREIMFFQSRYG